MRVTLIEVPYDCGRFGERCGAGPLALAAALPARLAAAGHQATVRPVRLPAGFHAEVAAVAGLQPLVRQEVGLARQAGSLPVVLAGNCGVAALGAVAALPGGAGALWLDAHADFNTPETSPSGFFDGMALATLVGRCWRAVTPSFAGFTPLAEERVLLLGARDLDAPEREALLGSRVAWLPPEAARQPGRLGAALDNLASRVEGLYLHLDLDAIDPSELRANGFAAAGGLTLAEMTGAIRAAGTRRVLAAVAVTAYDPQVDTETRGPAVATELIAAAAESVASGTAIDPT